MYEMLKESASYAQGIQEDIQANYLADAKVLQKKAMKRVTKMPSIAV